MPCVSSLLCGPVMLMCAADDYDDTDCAGHSWIHRTCLFVHSNAQPPKVTGFGPADAADRGWGTRSGVGACVTPVLILVSCGRGRQAQLARAMFPLASLRKGGVRVLPCSWRVARLA